MSSPRPRGTSPVRTAIPTLFAHASAREVLSNPPVPVPSRLSAKPPPGRYIRATPVPAYAVPTTPAALVTDDGSQHVRQPPGTQRTSPPPGAGLNFHESGGR